MKGNSKDSKNIYNGADSNIVYLNNIAIFNGSSYIDTTYRPNNIKGSISIWVSRNGSPLVNERILDSSSNNYSGTFQIVSLTNGSITLAQGNSSNNEIFITATKLINDNKFHHIVCSFGSGNSKLYIDGILQGTISTPPLLDIGSIMRIGSATDGFNPFHGSISQIEFYSEMLTDSEVLSLFSNFR